MCETSYASHIQFFGEASALCVSAYHHPQNGILLVNPSRGQQDGYRRVLHWGDEGQKIHGADICGESHG